MRKLRGLFCLILLGLTQVGCTSFHGITQGSEQDTYYVCETKIVFIIPIHRIVKYKVDPDTGNFKVIGRVR